LSRSRDAQRKADGDKVASSDIEIERKQKDVHANSRQQEKMPRFEHIENKADRASQTQIQSRENGSIKQRCQFTLPSTHKLSTER